ncbi:hypothetical protein GW17_00049290 [Ensete ventricosum]|nr:hypothetical protein GW17_00049290 [Ensete ventricosum]
MVCIEKGLHCDDGWLTSLCWVGRTASSRLCWKPSCPRAWGRDSQANICYIIPPSPLKDLLEAPDYGTNDKVSRWVVGW